MKFVTIITPCQQRCVPNFASVASSLKFRFIWKWIVVVGGFQATPSMKAVQANYPLQIDFVFSEHDNTSGNVLRNVGLQHALKEPRYDLDYIYYLDDDNRVHPMFWTVIYETYLARQITPPIFLFDACRNGKRFTARCKRGYVDTAQFLVAKSASSNWTKEYDADGRYIELKCSQMKVMHVHRTIAQYNVLQGVKRCPRFAATGKWV